MNQHKIAILDAKIDTIISLLHAIKEGYMSKSEIVRELLKMQHELTEEKIELGG